MLIILLRYGKPMKNKRILFITHYCTMAGANRSMLQLIQELRQDYSCWCFVLLPMSDNLPLKKFLEEGDIPYLEANVWWFKSSYTGINEKVQFLKKLGGIHGLYEKLKTLKFDLIHSNSGVIDIGHFLSRELRVKHVWHLREFGDLDYSLYPILGNLYQIMTYRCGGDAFVAISNAISNHYKKMIPKEKVHVIYNGICLDKYNLLAKHENTKLQMVCAGVIMPEKGQKEIVLAVNELVARGIINMHLTLVGFPTDYYVNEIKDYIEKNHLQEYVTILPETDDMNHLLSTMDIGIVPSKSEAFGRVTVEYMLQNLAVIVNDSGANCEIVQDGISGLIYKQGNHVALADKIEEIIVDRQKMIKLAADGRNRAMQRFLSSYNTESINNLYEELLQTPYRENLFQKYVFNVFLRYQMIKVRSQYSLTK